MAVIHCIRANASKSRFLIALLLFLGSLTLTACGGGSGGTTNQQLGAPNGGSGGAATDDEDETVTTTGVKVGNGTGGAFVEGVIGADDLTLQAGGTTTLRINFVDSDNDAYGAQVDVDLTSSCFANGLATFGNTQVETNTGGYGTTTYTANGCSGDDEIVATATVDEEVLTASVTLTVEADEVLGLTYEGASNTTLSLAGTGGTETTELTFRLIGAQGGSIVGESVSFAIQGDEGDATLAPGTDSDVSDSSGLVTTVLQSGTVATNIRVTATHDNTLETATSEGIVISAGLPIQDSLSLSQSSYNPALSYENDGVSVTLSVLAADQFGNRIAEGTKVNFYAECGVVEASCEIDASSSCSVEWVSNTSNQPLGDYRCSILAFTEGVESFDDINGNFVYEDTDVFDVNVADLPEPWVDADESGEYEVGEQFVDTANGAAGAYDLPNGLWDGLCLSGSVPTANCEGDDSATIFEHGLVTITCNGVTMIPDTESVGTVDLDSIATLDLSGGSVTVSYRFEDGCTPGNPPGEGISIALSGNGVEVVAGGSQTIKSTLTEPVSFQTLVRADDPGDDPPELKLVVTLPEGDTLTYIWGVTY